MNKFLAYTSEDSSNFSIGLFQMKPKFAAEVENIIENDSKLNQLNDNVADYVVNDYFDHQYNKINSNEYSDIDDTNLHYFYRLNKFTTYEFDEDALKNFISTFCGIILDETTFANIVDTKNLIYKQVLEYYRNNGQDEMTNVLNLIFNNTLLSSSNTNSTCCNNLQNSTSTSSTLNMISLLNSSTDSITNISCVDIYKQAMQLFLKKMLGDYEFYCDWFFIGGNEEYNVTLPNMNLIERLKKLFEEFNTSISMILSLFPFVTLPNKFELVFATDFAKGFVEFSTVSFL